MIRLQRLTVDRHLLAIVSAALLLSVPAAAQNAPSTPPPGGAPTQSMPMQGGPPAAFKPKNLKVLPENTDIIKVMRGFTAALGVECSFCHAPADPVTHRADRASDANPMKDQARVMIQMTDDLNKKYLTLLSKNTPTYDSSSTITCGTCHRGAQHPPAFVPPPRPEGERRPAAAPPASTNPS